MAIALRQPTLPRRRTLLRPLLVLAALAILLTGVALSGGFQLPGPVDGVQGQPNSAPQGPVLDGRGKWAGYTR
jgi:hypothetical protein